MAGRVELNIMNVCSKLTAYVHTITTLAETEKSVWLNHQAAIRHAMWEKVAPI